MIDLSVIVPAYNEGDKIYYNLSRMKNTFDTLGKNYEVVIVDDGSKDSTLKEAKKFSKKFKKFKVMSYKRNKGKGFAIKKGFFKTKGDLVTFIDADGDLPPKQIRTFLRYLKEYGADAVIGSKRHPDSNVDYPLKRKFLSWSYSFMNKILFNLSVKDTQSGLKLFKREVLEDVFPKTLVKRFAFDLEILANAHKRGYKIVEAPIVINHTTKFKGIGFKTIFPIFVDTIAIAYRMYIKRHYD